MATTAASMVDDLRDRLNDIADTQVPFQTKIRFLNRGQAAMFPRIFKTVRDNSVGVVAGQFEYPFPPGVGTGKVLTIEVESGNNTDRYTPLNRYDIIPSITVPTLVLLDSELPTEVGACFRITTADRMDPFVCADYAAAGSVLYSGPAGTEELPILYAMGLSTARILDDRMDYTRYSVTQVNNNVDPNAIMQVSQFWFAQFELLLDRLQMAFPVSRA